MSLNQHKLKLTVLSVPKPSSASLMQNLRVSSFRVLKQFDIIIIIIITINQLLIILINDHNKQQIILLFIGDREWLDYYILDIHVMIFERI